MTSRYLRALPLLFVLLWSTGFIGARLGLAHTEPLTFLPMCYLAVIVLITVVSLASQAPCPSSAGVWFHIGVAGLLMHGVYLGGVFTAISKGLPAGVASLVVGVQPLLTAVEAGCLLAETVHKRQWIGLLMGFLGVGYVVYDKLGIGFGMDALLPAIVALIGITASTLYQKRYCAAFDWRTGSFAQFMPSVVVTWLFASLTESFRVDWTGEF